MTGRGRVLLLEIAAALVTLGSVAAVAVPKAAELRERGAAARVLEDIEVVRGSVYAFYSDSAYFPAQLRAGDLPDGLAPYLPGNFSFRRPWGRLEYHHWPVAGDSTTAASSVIGISVTTTDPLLGVTAARRARDLARFSVGARHTFVVFGS